MAHTETFKLGFDVVDALTGPAIGRAKSATYRTADVVGLDTMAHVIRTMQETLPDDPWHRLFRAPPVLAGLIAQGALGQKTKAGFFRKLGKDIEVLDPAARAYRKAEGVVDPAVAEILAPEAPGREAREAARASASAGAVPLGDLSRSVPLQRVPPRGDRRQRARRRSGVALGLRLGDGTLRALAGRGLEGRRRLARRGHRRRQDARQRAVAGVGHRRSRGGRRAHATGAYSASANAFVPRSSLPVYRRQAFPDAVLGETWPSGTTIMETPAVRMWHLGDDVAIVSFRSKANTIGEDVLDGIQAAIERAERDCAALVLWQPKEPFSLGANLSVIEPAIKAGEWGAIEGVVAKFQQTSLRLRYSLVPTVAAVRGMALGGSCEFILHCDRTVAALESYIGLVEAGVGLLPGGAGCKEIAVRAAQDAARGPVGTQLDQLPFLRTWFQTVAMAKVSRSAAEAREMGFLRRADPVILNGFELLHVARATARALAEAGYRPPLPPRNVPVAGRTGIATLEMMLVNMRDGGFVSPYDFEIGLRIARVLCGGEVEPGSLVDEKWLLDLERAEFMALLHNAKTQERIAHTLKTGKPLRN